MTTAKKLECPECRKKMRYPSYTRYYWGTTGIGFGTGISWTLLVLGNGVQRYISKPHAIMTLYSIVAVCFIAQAWLLVRWNRQLKRDRAESDREWERIKTQYGLTDADDPRSGLGLKL